MVAFATRNFLSHKSHNVPQTPLVGAGRASEIVPHNDAPYMGRLWDRCQKGLETTIGGFRKAQIPQPVLWDKLAKICTQLFTRNEMPKKKLFRVKSPIPDDWIQVARIGVWRLVTEPHTGETWRKVRLVAVERRPEKVSYWLAWNGSRFADSSEYQKLEARNELLAWAKAEMEEFEAGTDLI